MSPPAELPDEWRTGVEWATLDLSASYGAVFVMMLPDAVQVPDPFHVVKRANTALDACRHRVQNEILGHRGRNHGSFYRARCRLVMARERLTKDQHDRLMGLHHTGDPQREVWFAWNAKEVVRQIYDHPDHVLAVEWVDEMALEVRRLGRSTARWSDQIIVWQLDHVSNGLTEAVNNLVNRVAFGMRSFAHYWIRSLVYAGKRNWDLVGSITPTGDPKFYVVFKGSS